MSSKFGTTTARSILSSDEEDNRIDTEDIENVSGGIDEDEPRPESKSCRIYENDALHCKI